MPASNTHNTNTKTNLNIAGIIVIILLLIGLYIFLKNGSLDNFIVFLDDVIIPKTCFDYLVFNGNSYYLFNSRLTYDGVNNPLQFTTKAEAIDYLKSIKCPQTLPFVDLVSRKKTEDVTVSYQRECNKKIAPNLFDLDICGMYGNDEGTLTSKYLAKINKIESDKKIYSNYDLESCMINKAVAEDAELDDSKFINEFKQYFDRLNSTIDEQYLYITG